MCDNNENYYSAALRELKEETSIVNVKLIKEIRRTSFDWVLDLQGLFRSGIICRFSRGKNKRFGR